MTLRFVSLVLTLALAGCATDAENVPPGPPEYRTGFAGGCNSGYVAGGHPYYQFPKDISLYLANALYKQGWDDGFVTCKGRYDAIQF